MTAWLVLWVSVKVGKSSILPYVRRPIVKLSGTVVLVKRRLCNDVRGFTGRQGLPLAFSVPGFLNSRGNLALPVSSHSDVLYFRFSGLHLLGLR